MLTASHSTPQYVILERVRKYVNEVITVGSESVYLEDSHKGELYTQDIHAGNRDRQTKAQIQKAVTLKGVSVL